jgi:hypothetical protein
MRKYNFVYGFVCVECMMQRRNARRLLAGKPEGKRPVRITRRGWLDSIQMDLIDIFWGSNYWINVAQDRDQL